MISQDIETFDLEDFKSNSVNMTAFRLVDLEEPKVAEVLRQMERFQPIGHAILNKTGVIQVGGKFKWPRGMLGHRKSLANTLKLVSPTLSRCSALLVETETDSSAFPRREHANTRSLKKEHTTFDVGAFFRDGAGLTCGFTSGNIAHGWAKVDAHRAKAVSSWK